MAETARRRIKTKDGNVVKTGDRQTMKLDANLAGDRRSAEAGFG